MAQLKENGICRIFYSSPFNGMEGEREDLTRRYWPQIQALCNSRGVQFVPVDMRWGITTELSDNNQTINICLREIDRSDVFIGFYGQRYGWHGETDEVLQRSFNAALSHFPWIEEHRDKSVTELEFLHGHLNHPGKLPAIICFRNKAWDDKHREAGLAKGDKKMVYKYSSESEHATNLLDNLKERVKKTEDKLLAINMSYETPEEAAKLMSECLLEYLDKTLLKKSSIAQMNERQQELDEHDAFCNTRTTFYIQPKDQLSALNSHVSRESGGVVLVTGIPGSGKTALLSFWRQQLKEQASDGLVIAYHFVGSTQASSDVLNLLERLTKELLIQGTGASEKDVETSRHKSSDEQENTVKSFNEFKEALRKVRAKEKMVVLVVDGLDKIKHALKTKKPLFWLPEPVPEGVHFVLATQTADTSRIHTLRESWASQLEEVEVQPLDTESQKLLCQEGLKLRGKELSPSQMEVVLNSEGTKNPLFLKIVLEELCMFGKFRELDKKIQSLVSCSSSEELFHLYLERMENDYNSSEYPGNLVEEVMCALYVSRHGLTEAEIMAAWNIPSYLWSPVYFGMQHYIITRQGFISIAYEDLKEAVYKRYIKSDGNRAKYYAKLRDYYYDVLTVQLAGDFKSTEKFRVMVELLHTAHMMGDTKLLWRIMSAPASLSALSKTTARSDLLKYVQDMGLSQDILVRRYIDEFQYAMVKSYCQQLEDLITEPKVVKEFIENMKILYAFLDFAHYHTAGEKILLKILEVEEKNPDIFQDDMSTVSALARHYIDMKLSEKSLPLQEKCVQAAEKRLSSGKAEDIELMASSCHTLGLAYMGINNTEKARECFARSIELHKKTSLEEFPQRDVHIKQSLSSSAQSLCEDGNYEESYKLYQQVRQMEDELYFGDLILDISYTLTNMAIVCRKLGKFEEAEKHYKKALEIKQNVHEGMYHFDIALAYTNLGNLANDRKDLSKAEENYRAGYEVLEKLEMTEEPTTVIVKDNLLLAMVRQEKYDEAFPLYWPDFYKLLHKLDWFEKSHVTVHFTMAQVLAFRHGKAEEACEILGHLVQTSRAEPDHFLYLNGIATDMLSKGGEAPYEQSLDRCFELFPDFVQAREQKVQKHLIPSKNLEEVISTIEGYYSHTGYTDDSLVVLCCQHCEEAGWSEGCLRLYEHFRSKFPDSEVILRNMASTYAKQGCLKESLQCFEELTQKNPGVWIFFDNIVMLKLRLEDYNGAKESMEVLAEAFPDLPESQEKVNYCADILREIHLNMAVKQYRNLLDEIDKHFAELGTSQENDTEDNDQ